MHHFILNLKVMLVAKAMLFVNMISLKQESPDTTAAGGTHLFKPVKVVLVDLELKAFLKASSLRHLHIHRTNVLFIVILLFLPQAAEVAEGQLPWLEQAGEEEADMLGNSTIGGNPNY